MVITIFEDKNQCFFFYSKGNFSSSKHIQIFIYFVSVNFAWVKVSNYFQDITWQNLYFWNWLTRFWVRNEERLLLLLKSMVNLFLCSRGGIQGIFLLFRKGRKWLVDFNAGKTQLVWFDWFNITCAIDVKMNGSVVKEKSSFKMLALTFSSNLNWGSYIISIAKTASKKIEALILLWNFFLLRLLCISINQPYGHTWNC